MFFPEDYQTVPRDIVDVMAALGAWRVWTGSAAECGSYDHRERRKVHYLWPKGHPVEEVLHERLSGPAEAVAPDGGRTVPFILFPLVGAFIVFAGLRLAQWDDPIRIWGVVLLLVVFLLLTLLLP